MLFVVWLSVFDRSASDVIGLTFTLLGLTKLVLVTLPGELYDNTVFVSK